LGTETQARVLEQRFIRQPLAEGITQRIKFIQSCIQQISYYDTEKGDFIVHTSNHYKQHVGDYLGFIHSQDEYRRIKIHQRSWLAHHLVCIWFTGICPSHKNQVDHINKIRYDNRLCNLRIVTNSVNCRNRKISNANTSGHSGICFHKAVGKWLARVVDLEGNRIVLGYFYNKDLAVKARYEFLQEHPELLYK
jgi:hypothetical protein